MRMVNRLSALAGLLSIAAIGAQAQECVEQSCTELHHMEYKAQLALCDALSTNANEVARCGDVAKELFADGVLDVCLSDLTTIAGEEWTEELRPLLDEYLDARDQL